MTRTLMMALILVSMTTGVVNASTQDDPALRSLARAREAYEASVEGTRAELMRAFEALRRAARNADQPGDAVEAVLDARDDFELTGTLSASMRKLSTYGRYHKRRDAMIKAYASAMSRLDAADSDLAGVINAERESFEGQRDIVPWGPNLVAAEDAETRTLAAGASRDVAESPDTSYRLEILATRTGDAGTLTVTVPLSDGRRVALPVVSDGDEFRLLITVHDDLLSADLGLARPVDLDGTIEDESTAITVQASEGAILIESVQVKSVIAKAPQAQVVGKTNRPAAPANQQPLFRVGERLEGEIWGKQGGASRATAKIQAINGHVVTLRVTVNGVTRDWLLAVNTKTKRFNVAQVQRVSARGKTLTIDRTLGSAIGNGRIHWHGTWTVRSPGWSGTGIPGRLDLKRVN